MRRRDPLSQLTSFRLEVDAETRARDLESIRTELRRRPPTRPADRRRWTLGVVVAVMLAGPAAAAASDGAMPGDLLYPVKLAIEPIVQLFDPDVVSEHRVEEVAALIDRGRDNDLIEERIEVARDVLSEADAPQLERELDRIVDQWVTDRTPSAPDVDEDLPRTTIGPAEEPTRRPDAREPEPPPSDTADPTSTTTRPSDVEPPPTDRTTTTVADSGGDERSRPRDAP